MGEAITSASVLTCPHGGAVSVSPSSGLVVDRALAASVEDQASISGCPEADPCVTAQWARTGVLLVDNVEIAMFPELSSCITFGGVNAGVPVVAQGTGGAIVAE
jgi:hypothetical protein